MEIKEITLSTNANVALTAYLIDQSPEYRNIAERPGVLIFPGGGYYYTSDREAEPIAMSYASKGFNTFILRYSAGEDVTFRDVFAEAEESLAIIRDHASDWYVDPDKIAVIGFSAGGHLAAALGTMGKDRPNALLLGYPCILSTMNDVLAFPVPSLDEQADDRTPPVFLFTTFEDETVPVENSLRFMTALNQAAIPFESHIFQTGKHGLSLGNTLTSNGLKNGVDDQFAQWFPMSVSWLFQVFGNFSADSDA